jgi:cytochrome c553
MPRPPPAAALRCIPVLGRTSLPIPLRSSLSLPSLRPCLHLCPPPCPRVRTLSTQTNRSKKHQRSLAAPHIPSTLWNSQTHCSGCGIRLQSKDPKLPGYVYRKQDTSKERSMEWRRKNERITELVETVYEGLDEEMIAKLENAQDKVKTMEIETKDGEGEGEISGIERMEQEWQEEQFVEDKGASSPQTTIQADTATSSTEESNTPSHGHAPEKAAHSLDQSPQDTTNNLPQNPRSSPKPPILKSQSSSPSPAKTLCLRCHEITYHSNPLLPQLGTLPPPKPLQKILSEIQAHPANRDPSNPPLLVHVLDIADFPLSFIPFSPPRGSKILYVINRADVVCESPIKLGQVRIYFRTELERILKERGMIGADWGGRERMGVEVHPVSAVNGWGIRELLARIFQLRNAESNVYLIGISPLSPFPKYLTLFSTPNFVYLTSCPCNVSSYSPQSYPHLPILSNYSLRLCFSRLSSMFSVADIFLQDTQTSVNPPSSPPSSNQPAFPNTINKISTSSHLLFPSSHIPP